MDIPIAIEKQFRTQNISASIPVAGFLHLTAHVTWIEDNMKVNAVFPHSVSICANGMGAVYTLSRYLDKARIPLSSAGEVVSPTGTVTPILHQYDRHLAIKQGLLANLQKHAERKYLLN